MRVREKQQILCVMRPPLLNLNQWSSSFLNLASTSFLHSLAAALASRCGAMDEKVNEPAKVSRPLPCGLSLGTKCTATTSTGSSGQLWLSLSEAKLNKISKPQERSNTRHTMLPKSTSSSTTSSKLLKFISLLSLASFALTTNFANKPNAQASAHLVRTAPSQLASTSPLASNVVANSQLLQHQQNKFVPLVAKNYVLLGANRTGAGLLQQKYGANKRLVSAPHLPHPQSDLMMPGFGPRHQVALRQHQLAAAAANQDNEPSANQDPKRQAGLLEKICIGTSEPMPSVQHNTSDHYQDLAERYANCTYVIGNLEISWLDEQSGTRPLDLSFLESIREITGYLMIAHVTMDKIRMPSLQLIRGRDLYRMQGDEKEEFALVLIDNQLNTLELPNLREILAGSVGSFNNPNLKHLRTIEWDEILAGPNYRSVFVYNGTAPERGKCDGSCHGGCWAEGAEMCQKLSKCPCGRCYGPTATECCHSFCAGGCTGPRPTDCLACKNFYDDGECIQECPSMMRYNPSKFEWESNPNGKYAFGATCVKECPEHLLRDNGACVRTCPPNKRSVGGECVTCGTATTPCTKNCLGVEVVHSGNIDQLVNCTFIEGSITILDSSFSGHLDSNGQRSQPMHPGRLEVFKTVREITGSLHIQANHSEFKDLSCFKNLQSIGGRHDKLYSLSITKSSLVELNLHSLRKVRSKVLIEENHDLCYADTIDWVQINITRREDIVTRYNAESSACHKLGRQCHQQCAQDGCWGSGPDECLSCNNYKFDDYCVDNCTSVQADGQLLYDSGGRTCKRCHPECKGGCWGAAESQCNECKNVKDGPHCRDKCPRHKYNQSGECLECDKSCVDGCTGPSNRLGQFGCNSCGKAIINITDPSQWTNLAAAPLCIRAEEPCPEGYYQEYVGPQAEGPLKSSSGKPVCRKCHHRCKSCAGMGTHVTVCECAKYVAGEQCEDYCPRDYYADEQQRQCIKCSPECDGCLGPTEADCITCRYYRIYYDGPVDYRTSSRSQMGGPSPPSPYDGVKSSGPGTRFNCTSQCPPDKPPRSETNMLDPYCSEELARDVESAQNNTLTAIVFVVSILVAPVLCACAYKNKNDKEKLPVKLTMHIGAPDDDEPLNPSYLKPNLAPLRSIKETELRKGKILGHGFGGTVYQGVWVPEGQHTKETEGRVVAIKVLRDNGQPNMNKEFLDEAYIMASVNHPNLVRLLAVCMTPNHLMLVTQLMPLGCLLEYVKKHRKDIDSKNLLEWCKQIARGMAYLEERRMVHRDLALRNVLLQTPGRALISDFGLAKLLELDQSEYHSGGGRLPIKWLAPECISKRKFTHKSDVWAFGVTVWELLTFGKRPFEHYDMEDMPAAIQNGARLEQPAHVTTEVYRVMLACWFYNPDDRPNFRGLVQSFVNFARDPKRYLICGIEKLDYNANSLLQHRLSIAESCDENEYEDYSEANSFTEEESQPMSAQPELTPSTHNRINEMFGFHQQQVNAANMRHNSDSVDHVTGPVGHHHHHQQHQRAQHLSTPALKKLSILHSSGQHLLHGDEEDVFASTGSILKPPNSATLMTDANNNNAINGTAKFSASSCYSMHHKVSTNSLGQKSEPLMDINDYLKPSPPCASDCAHFGSFYSTVYEPKSTPITPTGGPPKAPGTAQLMNPPHSADVSNEEYFLSLSNYVNQTNCASSQSELHLEPAVQPSMAAMASAGANNMPHSLV